MKVVKKILIGLLVLIAVLMVIGFFLPAKFHAERSAVISGKPEQVFALINKLENWSKWDPWHKMDPNWKITWGDTTEGLGGSYAWESENSNVGNGHMRICESNPNEKVVLEMYFMEDNEPAFGSFTLSPDGEGTKVVWALDGDMGMNPVKRWMGMMMGSMIGPMFEQGLADMEKAVKEMPGTSTEKIAGFDFEMRTTDKMLLAGIREKVMLKDLNSDKFSEWYTELGKVTGMQKLQPAGDAMALFYSYENGSTEMEPAFPVASMGKDEGKVKFHEMAGSKVLVVKYYGPYEKTEPVYNAAFEYLGKSGMKSKPSPLAWEVYKTGPMTHEADTSKWLTEIFFPVE